MSTIVGVERRSMPVIFERSGMNYCVVLVQGEDNDVAAYIGSGPPEWVAEHGDKLPLEEVGIYFPGFEQQMAARGMKYRR